MEKMLLNFLEQITKNSDISLTESIMDGYMTIFEAALAPILYKPNRFGNGGKFITDKGNRVEVNMYYNRSEDKVDIDFITNDSFEGEDYNDPQIMRGVFYLVSDILKIWKSNGKDVKTIAFTGMEEGIKFKFTDEMIVTVNDILNDIKHIKELSTKSTILSENSKSKINNLLDYTIKEFDNMKSNDVNKDGPLFELYKYIKNLVDVITQELDSDDLSDVDKHIKHGLYTILPTFDILYKQIHNQHDEYLANRGELNKRNRAYMTLTKRYFPNVTIDINEDEVTLHLPKDNTN